MTISLKMSIHTRHKMLSIFCLSEHNKVDVCLLCAQTKVCWISYVSYVSMYPAANPKKALSANEDTAVSSPTVPMAEHGKVGVKEGRYAETQWEWDGERKRQWKRQRERHGERRRRGYDSQRRCLPFFCVTPKPWNEPIHDDCFSLYLISPTASAILVHTVKWHLNIPVIKYGNRVGPSADTGQPFCCCAGSVATAHLHGTSCHHITALQHQIFSPWYD